MSYELAYKELNQIQNLPRDLTVDVGIVNINTSIASNEEVLLKLNNDMVGLTGIVDFTNNTLGAAVSPYTYYFFSRLNLLLAIHTDVDQTNL